MRCLVQAVIVGCPTEFNPSSAEERKGLLCAFFEAAVKLFNTLVMNFPFINFGVESKVIGMPTFLPAFKGYQLLSRGVAFLREHNIIVQCVSVERREPACARAMQHLSKLSS